MSDTNDGAFLSFEVTEEQEGMPLASYLRSAFGMSRAMIRRLRKDASVKADGIPVPLRHRLRRGERITLHVPSGLMSNVEPEPLPLVIYYEDPHLLVVEKPAGQLVHPAHSEFRGTLANGVAYHLLAQGEPSTAGPVTRLDRNTSGLVLFAKHPHAHHRLNQAIARGGLDRHYLGIVEGHPEPDEGTIDAPIVKAGETSSERRVAPEGQRAITRYRVLRRFAPSDACQDGAALVEFALVTGRTHQIRVHAAHLGHPLVGDPLYGNPRQDLIGRQALHAHRLDLTHPIDGTPLTVESPLPDDLSRLVERLAGEQPRHGRRY